MASHRVNGLAYGHFGDGCVHVRLDIPLERSRRPVARVHRRTLRTWSSRTAVRVRRARRRPRPVRAAAASCTPTRARAVRRGSRRCSTRATCSTPAILVRPAPLDADLRRPQARPLLADGRLLVRARRRRPDHRGAPLRRRRASAAPTTRAAGGFMCPSYLATKDEKDSTRGRARVLQEMANGSLVSGGWSSPEVHESLDLCLSCKACSSDCPAGVDMAQYKSEVLHRTYRRQAPAGRPLRARLAAAVGAAGDLASPALAARWPTPCSASVRSRGGARRRRDRHAPPDGDVRARAVPRLGWRRVRTPPARRPPRDRPGRRSRRRGDARRTASRASSSARRTGPMSCSGPTPSPTRSPVRRARGRRRAARCRATRCSSPTGRPAAASPGSAPASSTARRPAAPTCSSVLGPYAVNGIPIVGLEPSCTAVLRSDLLDLLPDDPRAVRGRAATTRTLAELLTAPPRSAPATAGRCPTCPTSPWSCSRTATSTP